MREPLREAAALLDSQWTMVLGVTLDSGAAHCAPLYFVRGEGFTLYWLSSPESLHSRVIAAGAPVSASVFRPSRQWNELRGLQIRGAARPVRKHRALIEKYKSKFSLGAELDPVISRSRLYCLEPRWMRLIDNRRGFGWNQEWEFPILNEK
ncbi:MAG: pyridoxamine 5'-phosphate oxidase family protein [Bryobacteraceae bacterium]